MTENLGGVPGYWEDNTELRRSLRRLASTPTARITVTQTRVNGLVRAAFGQHRTLEINRWETVHGDLHWG